MKPRSHLGFLLRDLFSGKDRYTLDLGRILWALAFLVFLGLTVYSIVAGVDFDFVSWCGAVGLLLAAGGTALKIKETTEPTEKP